MSGIKTRGIGRGSFYTRAPPRVKRPGVRVCPSSRLCESIAATPTEGRTKRMATPETGKRGRVSQKAGRFTESVIREMTREALKHGAVNLSQGFPDFPAPEDLKRAAAAAIGDDVNQYAVTWGAKDFREAIADKTRWFLGLDYDPEREITVTCGSTEGMIAAMMATVDPGEEVVVFEPFYENYAPDAILSGATPRYVSLRAPDWTFDPDELRAAFNPRTKAVILCNPEQPDGQGLHARRDGVHRLALPGVRRALLHRRDLRAHPLPARRPRGRAHLDGPARRDARPHACRQLDVEDLLGHGLARRLRARAARHHERRAQGTRLPDGRRRRAPPTRGRLRPADAARVLRRARRRVPTPTRHAAARARRRGLQGLPTRRRLLRDDGHLGLRLQ